MKEIKWEGKPISKPGLYVGVPMDDYHSQKLCVGPSVSSSNLRRVLEANGGSPAHFWAEWTGNPDHIEIEETEALVMGRAAHHLMLGGPFFKDEFIVRPDTFEAKSTRPGYIIGHTYEWKGACTECRDWMEKARETDRTIVTLDQVQTIKGMSMRLGKHPTVRQGILGHMVERSIVLYDEESGLWVKSRPDAIPTDSGEFCDYKTTTSTAWTAVMRTVTEYGYHQQAALVRRAAREVLKMEQTTHWLVLQEKKPPYCVRVVKLDDRDLDMGEKQNKHALRLIARCLKEQHWPDPGEDQIGHVRVEDWYRTRVESGFTA